MHESDDEQRARLAYEASLRALDQQRRSLEEIRSRTGVLLAAASVSASFLGSKAFERHADVIVTCSALAALVITLLSGVLVLTLDEGLTFSLSGSALYAGLAPTCDRAGQHRQLSYWLDGFWTHNERRLQSLNLRFRFTTGALAIQIVLWTLALGATVDAGS